MQFILDHLIATLVAATLGLSLFSQQIQNRQAAMERQAVYHAKSQALVFGEWLEDDVVRLGARFGRSRDRFQAVTETIDGKDFTRRFEYYYNEGVVTQNVLTRVEVVYELQEDNDLRLVTEKGATAADDEVMQTYTITRQTRKGEYNIETDTWVMGEPTWQPTADYQAPRGLRYFYIEPRDSNGLRVPDERSEEADYVRLEFIVMPTLFPLHRARLIPEDGLQWATTIEIRPF